MSQRGEILAEPLQEAFAKSGMSISAVARRAGYDESHVRRALRPNGRGYVYRKGKRYGPYLRTTLSYETAVRLARAMDVDPFEVGL